MQLECDARRLQASVGVAVSAGAVWRTGNPRQAWRRGGVVVARQPADVVYP